MEIKMKKQKFITAIILLLISFAMICMNLVACRKPYESINNAETIQNKKESTENKDTICQTKCSDPVSVTETTEPMTTKPTSELRVLDYNRIAPSDITIYEFNVSNDNNNSIFYHSSDIDLSLKTSTVPELKENELVYNIMGTSLTSRYGSTFSTPYYNGIGNYYSGVTDSGVEFVMAVNSETGKLHDFYYRSRLENGYDVSVLDDFDKPILTETECQKIAEKFFYNEMKAIGNYHITVQHRAIPEYANGIYVIKFERTVDNMKTDEYVSFDITERGRIISLYTNMFGSMDGIIIPDYDEAKVIDAVEYKLSNIYQKVIQTHTVSYEIADMRLTRLQDGKLYLKYQLEIMISTSDGDFFAYDHTNLLVCIN